MTSCQLPAAPHTQSRAQGAGRRASDLEPAAWRRFVTQGVTQGIPAL
ncbi:Unknown protein sequence [Pseudomonas tremae]|uniref:Uncharacterized protein n=1 Tax=Pseudomonas tremae TaxID=200454 RepID=A0AA40TWX9_9PSED|nr:MULTISPECIES: hypothetical protein [Pseudomonas syringae group]KPZ06766.1 Unknown protein sequence [Pseudomonas tremae]RMO09663.1 hypothetical protein ALQ48_02733 [Pseudomonas coronafaciens pv. zizaniae]